MTNCAREGVGAAKVEWRHESERDSGMWRGKGIDELMNWVGRAGGMVQGERVPSGSAWRWEEQIKFKR